MNYIRDKITWFKNFFELLQYFFLIFTIRKKFFFNFGAFHTTYELFLHFPKI